MQASQEESMRWLTLGLLFSAACDAGQVDGTQSTGFTFDDLPTLTGGQFAALAPYQDIDGQAFMARQLDGSTELYIAVSGLKADLGYTAHLHVAACAANGGGHYKIDPNNPATVEANELWLRGRSSLAGTLFSQAAFAHRTRDDAKSIVVHDPINGAKMACADLAEQ
jgi:hypothetical protein